MAFMSLKAATAGTRLIEASTQIAAAGCCVLLLLLLWVLLMQAVSESNRDQLQPLIDVALQCAYNTTIQSDAKCRPTTLSIAIAAVATVQQYNMTADFVELTKSMMSTASVLGKGGDTVDASGAAETDARAAATAKDVPSAATAAAPAADVMLIPSPKFSATGASAAAGDSSSSGSSDDINLIPTGDVSADTPVSAAAVSAAPHACTDGKGTCKKHSHQRRGSKTAIAAAQAASAKKAAAKAAPAVPGDRTSGSGVCDYNSYAPGEYPPDSCPAYFVSTAWLLFHVTLFVVQGTESRRWPVALVRCTACMLVPTTSLCIVATCILVKDTRGHYSLL